MFFVVAHNRKCTAKVGAKIHLLVGSKNNEVGHKTKKKLNVWNNHNVIKRETFNNVQTERSRWGEWWLEQRIPKFYVFCCWFFAPLLTPWLAGIGPNGCESIFNAFNSTRCAEEIFRFVELYLARSVSQRSNWCWQLKWNCTVSENGSGNGKRRWLFSNPVIYI